ncbi:ephrin-B2, partial [Acomys russatus]
GAVRIAELRAERVPAPSPHTKARARPAPGGGPGALLPAWRAASCDDSEGALSHSLCVPGHGTAPTRRPLTRAAARCPGSIVRRPLSGSSTRHSTPTRRLSAAGLCPSPAPSPRPPSAAGPAPWSRTGADCPSCVRRGAPEPRVHRAAAPRAFDPTPRPEGCAGQAHLVSATAGAARRVCPGGLGGRGPRPVTSRPGVRRTGSGLAVAMARSRRDSVWKYCWGLLMVLCRTAISRSIVLEPIYWNSSNSKFLPGQGLVLYPQIGDKLDIICPKVDSKTVGQYEYYKVYMVDKDQADRCTIKKENTPLLNCARPDQDVKFTIKFQEFSPNLWGLEFQKNKDYYIISTSNGSLEGLDNQEGGVCQTRAMKILMKVGQDASSAGSPRNNDPTRRPELEAGTNGRSSTTSPFVKPNPGSSTDGNSAGHSGNNLLGSEVALFAGIASGCIIFIVIIITLVVLLLKYRRRHRKHSPQHTTTLSLSTLATPKRGGNNNGSEPSDVIIPLRTADSVFCPHYEKVSGDYGHPVYIVQEMPPQSPANIYYKV